MSELEDMNASIAEAEGMVQKELSKISPGTKACLILSPEYTYVDVVCDDGSGPTMSEHGLALVFATSRKKAAYQAIKLFRQDRRWCDDVNPFVGVTIINEPVIFYLDDMTIPCNDEALRSALLSSTEISKAIAAACEACERYADSQED